VVNLLNLADGEIIDKLNRELEKVAQNIADKNTDPKKERKITLQISFKPNENRDSISTSVVAKTSLAPERGIETLILMGKDSEGKLHLNEVRQQSIFDSKPSAKITNIK
jgi:hypothetical protein